MLAERAVENAREVEKAYGADVDDGKLHSLPQFIHVTKIVPFSEDEWDGVGGSSGSGRRKGRAEDREEEYEDEEQLATVTVVEDFDPDELLHGPKQTDAMDEDAGEQTTPRSKPPLASSSRTSSSKPAAATEKKAYSKTGTKPKKIKYQTNAARKVERGKQQKRKLEKAARAGGKASRKRGGKR